MRAEVERWKGLAQKWYDGIEAQGAEIKRLRAAIIEHRDALDARALGNPEQVARDRDDIDNALYNATGCSAAFREEPS